VILGINDICTLFSSASLKISVSVFSSYAFSVEIKAYESVFLPEADYFSHRDFRILIFEDSVSVVFTVLKYIFQNFSRIVFPKNITFL
jgi:hypothetical protein